MTTTPTPEDDMARNAREWHEGKEARDAAQWQEDLADLARQEEEDRLAAPHTWGKALENIASAFDPEVSDNNIARPLYETADALGRIEGHLGRIAAALERLAPPEAGR